MRYGLQSLIERAYNELTCELRPIADRSVAILCAGGGDALSQPVADLEALVAGFTEPGVAGAAHSSPSGCARRPTLS